MIYVQTEARGRLQPTCYNRPSGNQPHERNNSKAGPEKSGNADGDIGQPFKYQQSPAVLLAADGPHSRDDSEDSIDQHIGGEKDHQRQHRWTGKDQRDASEDNGENASQREQPPVSKERFWRRKVRGGIDCGARHDMLQPRFWLPGLYCFCSASAFIASTAMRALTPVNYARLFGLGRLPPRDRESACFSAMTRLRMIFSIW